MNKSVIKNFAIWARNKLIADIQYRAGLMGITADGIHSALPQSTRETEFYDIGTAKPYTLTGEAVKQRRSLVDAINQKTSETNYQTAYKYIMESVAYTWFNRLIAIRFMEINDYLPSHIRVLSSESGKMEPDLVTTPFDGDLPFTDTEKRKIVQLKSDNNLDECFRILFIKQCNALGEILPALFEKTADYSELLLNISAIDKEGIVYRLINDIPEDDFNVEKGGQVEIIGWLYQYYNTEPKNEAFAKSGKITKEEIPAVTQLFTPDWIVRYMVENSLGRLWVEGHPDDLLKSRWKYYLEEARQERSVQEKLDEIHRAYAKLNPEDIRFIDPCMGSGHILVYAFDVLMQIYETAGYSRRDAAKSILENNLYGLDIDDRAYQMAYFAVMMKARQYHRRILSAETVCHVYSIQESNPVNRDQLKYFGVGLSEAEKKDALNQMGGLLDSFKDAKEYGSILHVEDYDWGLLRRFAEEADVEGQMTFDTVGLEQTREKLRTLMDIGEVMARKYEVVVTNPPYMGISSGSIRLSKFIKQKYPISKADLYSVFIEKCGDMLCEFGYQAMITQHSWMFLGSFEALRELVMKCNSVNMVHLGARAFDEITGEVVQTTSFVLQKVSIVGYLSKYVRLVEGNNENEKKEKFFSGDNVYLASVGKYELIPGKPVAYWLSDKFIESFTNKKVSDFGETREGITTANNDLFLKRWYEVKFEDICFNCPSQVESESMDSKWYPHHKGGAYRRWYGNYDYVINWQYGGKEVQNYKDNQTGRIRSHNYNLEYVFREYATWSRISSENVGLRYSPIGFTFDSASAALFLPEHLLKYGMGFVCSCIAKVMLSVLNPTIKIQPGDVADLPFIICEDKIHDVNENVERNIRFSKEDWDSFETSWDFKRHPLLPPLGKTAADGDFEKDTPPLPKINVLSKDYTKEETEFAIFCIENVAMHLQVDASVVYTVFAKDSDILDGYIIPCYDVLHTQGKEYIVDDLIDLMREKGVTL